MSTLGEQLSVLHFGLLSSVVLFTTQLILFSFVLLLLSPLTSLIRRLGVNEKPFTTQDCVEYFQTSRAAEDANNAGCVNEVWWEYIF